MGKKSNSAPACALSMRPLQAEDLDAVVAIDATLGGRQRRDFFQRRLQAALKEPKAFVFVGACIDGELKGYALVRLLGGEFGHDKAGMLDAIGVDPAHRGAGVGRELIRAVDEVLRHKGIDDLRTETEWTNAELLGFFASSGFQRAPRLVLKRDVASDLDW